MKKTIVITGGTSGLGLITVKELLRQDWNVVVLARNPSKMERLRRFENSDNLDYVPCDLSDLSSVKSASDILIRKNLKIDVLMNNAGGFVQNLEITDDGYEKTFQINHLGHFLLTLNIIEELVRSESKIINISSLAHRRGDLNFDDVNYENRRYQNFLAYCDSKLCNIHFTTELHRRYNSEGIRSFAVHPGVVNTGFADDTSGGLSYLVKLAKPFLISPEKGAETQIYLATNERMDKYSGRYFTKKRPTKTAEQGENREEAEKLWEFSESAVQKYLI